MANPNIVNATNIYLKTIGNFSGSTGVTILSNAASSGKVYKITHLRITNTGGATTGIKGYLYQSSTEVCTLFNFDIPYRTVFIGIDKDSAFYLMEDQSIVLDLAFGVHATVVYEDIS